MTTRSERIGLRDGETGKGEQLQCPKSNENRELHGSTLPKQSAVTTRNCVLGKRDPENAQRLTFQLSIDEPGPVPAGVQYLYVERRTLSVFPRFCRKERSQAKLEPSQASATGS